MKDGQSHLPALFDVLRNERAEVELIFLDDGSTDGSHGLLCEYVEAHVGSLLLQNELPLGVGVGRTQLLTSATGQYVWFVDCDDLPDIDAALALLQRFPDTDAILAQAHLGSGTPRSRPKRSSNRRSGAAALQELSCGTVDGYLWNKIFRASLFEGRGWPLLSTQEDLCMVAVALSRSACVQITDDIIYRHLFHRTSIMLSGPPELQNIEIASDYVRSLLIASSLGKARRQLRHSLNYFSWNFEVRSYATLPLYTGATQEFVDDGLRRAVIRLSGMSSRSFIRFGVLPGCSALMLKWKPRLWIRVFSAKRSARTRIPESLREWKRRISSQFNRKRSRKV